MGVLRDASQGSGTSQFAVIAAMGPLHKVEVVPVNLRTAAETERNVAAFAEHSE